VQFLIGDIIHSKINGVFHGATSFPRSVGLAGASEVKVYGNQERRKRPRAELHWAVRLFTGNVKAPIETRTENLSADGFYCVSPEPFAAGQVVRCVIKAPWHSQNGEGPLSLCCQARIVRVKLAGSHGPFGIGCRIEEYSVTVESAPNS